MSQKTKKRVLVVDDEQPVADILRDAFVHRGQKEECPYEFEVEIANSAADCVKKIRAASAKPGPPSYDVVVLDVRMESETSGIEAALALGKELGWDRPVRVVFTGYPSYGQCVEAMRHGAWDYIVKEDVEGTPATKIVVDSVVARLRQLDLRDEQERRISREWLPAHFAEVEKKYGGQLVALWHEPEVKVIASGRDAFELEEKLKSWREGHQSWELPFILTVPCVEPEEPEEG